MRFGSSNRTTVGMLAMLSANRLDEPPYRQSSLPESAANETTLTEVSVTYCLNPPARQGMIDEYPADSPSGVYPRHASFPSFFRRASMVASRPPGVHITFSPSTRGDSKYCQVPLDPL